LAAPYRQRKLPDKETQLQAVGLTNIGIFVENPAILGKTEACSGRHSLHICFLSLLA
jgi:hypothetical protein